MAKKKKWSAIRSNNSGYIVALSHSTRTPNAYYHHVNYSHEFCYEWFKKHFKTRLKPGECIDVTSPNGGLLLE